ncbi:hypothetical protein BC826DRAFT_524323 [Russula brevipes]|nr:hypothetical protein BC826DRAFT_524323 [Russula brevipes]
MISHRHKRVRQQISAVTPSVAPSLLPNIPGSSVPTSSPSRKLVIGRRRRRMCPCRVSVGTADQSTEGQGRFERVLPDDVLLEIFNVYTDEISDGWPTLVHVCRLWRNVVFASTHRLNLQLLCTDKTPAGKMLDIWPALPIIIKNYDGRSPPKGADNIVAALGHPGRVRQIDLWNIPQSDLGGFALAMKVPFPELTFLSLGTTNRNAALVLPDSFLGGSAPRLQVLYFKGISFPAIPNLLSSASDLVELRLWDIPDSGYISPEAMVTGLSALTSGKTSRASES